MAVEADATRALDRNFLSGRNINEMMKRFAALRYMALVAVGASFITAATMLVAGTVKVFKIIWYYAQGTSNVIHVGTEQVRMPHLSQEDGVTARAIESLDTFLIAVVLIYFAYGIYVLICARKDDPIVATLPPTIVPGSFSELKNTLGQIIIVVLMVLFTRQVWLEWQALSWEHLVIPGGVLLLGAGMRLSGMGRGGE